MSNTLATLILVGNIEFVEPAPGDGYTVIDPHDPQATMEIMPHGGGSYLAIKPHDPQGLKLIMPNGDDSYLVIEPFNQEGD